MFKIMTGTTDPTDMLQRFSCGGEGNLFPSKPKEEYGRPENVELTLGLSSNGRFGLEPQRSVANDDNNSKKKLFRASSVTNFVNFPVDVELSLYSPLTRTCSLPPETEAEWRRRKDLQSLRRSEAKRKRIEKLKNLRVVKGKTREDSEPNGRNSGDGVELPRVGMKESPPSPSLSASTSPPPAPPLRFPSQGSIGSSGVSELDSQPSSGTNRDTSETNVRHELNKVQCNPMMRTKDRSASDQTMPCVSTKGEGPDDKRIQGFLYRYGKGEEVRIVCVCHGSFLTPAEFVKHGGGGDVEYPLRHIVVTSLFS